MSCVQTFADYGFRALGIGERALPKTDITLCEQVVLIGSGMFWNIYFALLALLLGFVAASLVAFARNSTRAILWRPAAIFIFILRGSPLFLQFFLIYETFVLLPKVGFDLNLGFVDITVETRWLTRAWLGALIVLFLNTTAYTAQIFYGALRSVPKGEIEAALAMGMTPNQINRRIIWPTMLRLAWPSYTNEAIFLFHATALVFFSSFPAWQQKGDALYYASYFADKTFNPFVPYPIIAVFFIAFTLLIILIFGFFQRRLNRHL
ncbi:amino acid ABC transporter permease [Amylibacter marinus]|uniref:Amino acid ABC transporter permease n=1 Tax=Amylibacter marinus TaxID=1475483 RepID=A0ABQ5VYW7_9RHOB|nr:ABC transporter permease subunit [Amylibacter marinus]GLQ36281.1 amino acid ABC transporter permease [Amylibacter marinus]